MWLNVVKWHNYFSTKRIIKSSSDYTISTFTFTQSIAQRLIGHIFCYTEFSPANILHKQFCQNGSTITVHFDDVCKMFAKLCMDFSNILYANTVMLANIKSVQVELAWITCTIIYLRMKLKVSQTPMKYTSKLVTSRLILYSFEISYQILDRCHTPKRVQQPK